MGKSTGKVREFCQSEKVGTLILVPDDDGIHRPHLILPGNMHHVKNLVGPQIQVPVMPAKQPILRPPVFQPHPFSRVFGDSSSLGSAGSSLLSTSSASLSSQASAGAQSTIIIIIIYFRFLIQVSYFFVCCHM